MPDAAPETLSDLVFYVAAAQRGRKKLVSAQRSGERYWISTEEWIERIRGLAAALEQRGIQRADRVAIFAENCPEWHIVEFACQLLGAITVPVYPTLPADQVAFILQDAGCDWVFYSNQAKAAILQEIQESRQQPLECVAFELDATMEPDLHLETMLQPTSDSKPLDSFRSRPQPSDIATLIYTSGTTGKPKGVILSHRNLLSNILACADLFVLGPSDTSLSFLPLSHVFQRTVDNLFFYKGVSIHYLQSIERVPRALLEIRPTVLASVPRLYERAFLRVMANVEKETPGKKRIFSWAIGVGERYAEAKERGKAVPHLAAQRRLAHRLVYRKIHQRMGGRLRLAITGGAALPEKVGRFFGAVGLDLFEGYGLTETAPVLCIGRPGAFRWGSVGTAVPGVELRIAADGEILARSPGLMQGYWDDSQATAEAIDPEGWFHTGDIGELDPDGFLKITDRKKDLLVTSGGKNIAPQPLEQLLTSNGIIAQAVVVGNNYPYLTALLVPNFEDLPAELADLSPAERITQPKLLERIEATVAEVNRRVAEHERIRRWKLLPQEFSLEKGEITPTLKVRRRVVFERYAELVQSMYLKSQRVESASPRG